MTVSKSDIKIVILLAICGGIGIAFGVVNAGVCIAALVGVCLLVLYARAVEQKARARNRAALEARQAEKDARAASTLARIPPIWPPRKPDDWGLAEENAYREALHQHQQISAMAGSTGSSWGSPPRPVMQKSWEAYHRAIQDNDPLQVRWAQNEGGEWIKVIWGNAARRPAGGSALPVFQVMKHKENGEWHWIGLGNNVPLDWQRGPVRVESITTTGDAGKVIYLRPCGSPAHQDAPPPIKPESEHGSSDWQSPDDLAALGAVRPRRQ